eukprot:Rhum_TRINITY_DN12114_c0_g1::Rhum_TRINITY_DN12114_c0_g1_i1::g.49461::m.49461
MEVDGGTAAIPGGPVSKLICGGLLRRIQHEGDSVVQLRTKQVLLFGLPICLVVATVSLAVRVEATIEPVETVPLAVTIALSAVMLVWMLVTHRVSILAVQALLLVLLVLCIFPMDLQSAREMKVRWFWGAFLILDVSLLCRLSSTFSHVVFALSALWLVVTQVNDATHVLFDLVYDPSFIKGRDRPPVCDCPNPPCTLSGGDAASQFLGFFGLLLANYVLMMWYAAQMKHENRIVSATVETARNVATRLAHFDLEAASAILEDGDGGALTPALRETFTELLANLRFYRPYLPRSCLPLEVTADGDPQASHNERVDNPGLFHSRRRSIGALPMLPERWPSGERERRASGQEKERRTSGPVAERRVSIERRVSVDQRRVSGSDRSTSGTSTPLMPLHCSILGGGARSSTVSALGAGEHTDNTTADLTSKASADSHDQDCPSVNSESLTSVSSIAWIKRHRNCRLTQVVTNLHDTLAWGKETHAFESRFSYVLEQALRVFHNYSGMVDLFLGDRITVSFNSAKICSKHPSAALAAAREFDNILYSEAPCNMAVVTGSASCGDIGCADMRRYSVLGMVPLAAGAFERVGRALGVRILLNAECQRDVFVEHPTRLVPREARLER